VIGSTTDATIDGDTAALLPVAMRLAEISRDLGLADLAGSILGDTERRLGSGVVRVLVLGEIKQGKSSLVNALLGREVLPVGVTPTTGATVIVRVSDTPGTWGIGEDGSAELLDSATFVRRAKGAPRGESDATGHLEVHVGDDVLPIGLELVDTPGINDIANWRATISRGELPSADVLILVLDSTQLLNRSEMVFLRDALAAVGGLRDSGARLLLAVNRIDLVAESDRPLLREYLDRELHALVGDAVARDDVFETEARGALREPSATRHGVAEVARLRRLLFDLARTRGDVLPTRARASLGGYARLLAHNAAVAAHALALEQDALRREIRSLEREWEGAELDMTAVRASMQAARDRLLAASAERIAGFRGQVQASASAAIGVASQRILASHLPSALHDAMLAFAAEESTRLHEELDALTEQALHTHSEHVRRLLAFATLRLGFRGPTIYLDPPSIALEIGMIAIGVVGTAVMYFGNLVAGMVMTIAGPLATVVLREQSLRDARVRARAELPIALDRAAFALQDAVTRTVDQHIAALDEHMVLANRALAVQLGAVLRRAQATLTVDDAPSTTELVAARRSRAQVQLHAVELELAAIIGRLSAPADVASDDHPAGDAASPTPDGHAAG
jgi:small GTP-binding protein